LGLAEIVMGETEINFIKNIAALCFKFNRAIYMTFKFS